MEPRRNNRGPGPRNARNAVGGFGPSSRATDFPLRILVPSEMVGAIIGRQGSTIRTITQQSRARLVGIHIHYTHWSCTPASCFLSLLALLVGA